MILGFPTKNWRVKLRGEASNNRQSGGPRVRKWERFDSPGVPDCRKGLGVDMSMDALVGVGVDAIVGMSMGALVGVGVGKIFGAGISIVGSLVGVGKDMVIGLLSMLGVCCAMQPS